MVAFNSDSGDRLFDFLNGKGPSLRRLMVELWDEQASGIPLTAIEAAINGGTMNDTFAQLNQSYTAFINDVVGDYWNDAFLVGFNGLAPALADMGGVEFADVQRRLATWVSEHGGELIVELTSQQQQAIGNLLQYFTGVDPVNPRTFARYLRPAVGLTGRESQAVLNFRNSLRESGVTGDALVSQTNRYATRLHKVRAERIARTELAFAHNQSQVESVREAVELGYFPGGAVVKVWHTAEDERVCPRCGPLGGWKVLDGQGKPVKDAEAYTVGLEDTFPSDIRKPEAGTVLTPPLHPNCRCTILYETETA